MIGAKAALKMLVKLTLKVVTRSFNVAIGFVIVGNSKKLKYERAVFIEKSQYFLHFLKIFTFLTAGHFASTLKFTDPVLLPEVQPRWESRG